jgi:hypothetical protein
LKNLLYATVGCLSVAALSMGSSLTLATGVDGSGHLLASGATDPTWSISVDGGSTYNPAIVAYPIDICCGMETVTSAANWVTDPSTTPSSPATAWGVGNPVDLTATFDLTGFDLSTTTLTGTFRVADDADGIYLNGNLIAGTQETDSWAADIPLTASSGFVSGINTIRIAGDSINSEYDGFWLSAIVTDGVAETPEPSTILTALTGAILIALVYRRRTA